MGIQIHPTHVQSHLGIRMPLIHSIVSNDSASRQPRPAQTARMHRLVWAFVVCICQKIRFHMRQPRWICINNGNPKIHQNTLNDTITGIQKKHYVVSTQKCIDDIRMLKSYRKTMVNHKWSFFYAFYTFLFGYNSFGVHL